MNQTKKLMQEMKDKKPKKEIKLTDLIKKTIKNALDQLDKDLAELSREGEIYEPTTGIYRFSVD
jgi:rRNA pseudouridine-1189 N-methylase Emg1 (Nep1/Mra1 family)